MRWKTFCENAELAIGRWQALRENLTEIQAFLKKSYPVIAVLPEQVPFMTQYPYLDLLSLAGTYKILDPDHSRRLITMLNQYSKEKRQSHDTSSSEASIRKIEHESVVFSGALNIEIRFPYIDTDAIDVIKRSGLVDKTKTCLCKTCIRAIIA